MSAAERGERRERGERGERGGRGAAWTDERSEGGRRRLAREAEATRQAERAAGTSAAERGAAWTEERGARLGVTPSQTVGPFLAIGLPWPDGPDVVLDGHPGAFLLHGVVTDGGGEPVRDALIESWQADPDGRFDHPDDPRGPVAGFRGFGRCPTDDDGRYAIRTVKPGLVPGPDGVPQAPHIDITVLARGLLHHLVTRVYFADEAERNGDDAVLRDVPERRRATLLAVPDDRGYRFDIRLQGDDETVFFAL
jgi:protocatechuate 3,4-dioxygenase alpha subunit